MNEKLEARKQRVLEKRDYPENIKKKVLEATTGAEVKRIIKDHMWGLYLKELLNKSIDN